jgi:hypothetical protein
MNSYWTSHARLFLIFLLTFPKVSDFWLSLLETLLLIYLILTSRPHTCRGALGSSGLHPFLPETYQQPLKNDLVIYNSRLASHYPSNPPALSALPWSSFKMSAISPPWDAVWEWRAQHHPSQLSAELHAVYSDKSTQLTCGLQNTGKVDSWKWRKLGTSALQPPNVAAESLLFANCSLLK